MARERGHDAEEALQRILSIGATNLTQRIAAGQAVRAYGREQEIAKVCASLAARQSVLLLGPSDVGKTAILHEVAARMSRRQGPAALAGARLVGISTGAVLAGTRYLGEWQTRLTELLDAVKEAGNVFLYFEDIWALRDAGRASDKTDGFSTVIRPYLERKDLVLLGETTQESYTAGGYGARALADDTSFLKLFTVVPVEEPDREATKTILRAVSRDLERNRKVSFDATAIDRALELTRRFLPYQAFPGKATRLLEESAKGLADDARTARDRRVMVETISAAFSRLTGLPEKIISDSIPLTQDEILAYFNEHIVGQEEAITAVADVVTLVKAELNDPGRPLGVLFFVGPTGVGKTELAKTLADYLFGSKEKLIRFDMSEYKTYASLPDLLQNLTERQRRQSFSVLLLDEIEKAGPFVFDLFLQAFDDARLTDATGRAVDLRNTIIILTSNIGTDLSETRGIGFVENRDRQVERRQQVIKAVETYFRPEFINRLDKILVFQPLGREQMRHIARRELNRALLREGVLRRNILLDFREEVLDVLLEHGFSPTYGARPLQRAIKDYVLLSLARRIAAQPAAGEQLLELFVQNGKIDAAMIPVTAATAPEEVAGTPAHGGERVSIVDAETGRERRLDLRRLAGEVVALRERIEAQIAGERYAALQARNRALLDESASPTFWDDPQRSHYVLAAIYHGERVTDRFDNLRNRGERLEETATMIRRHGDATDVARLANKYDLLSRDVMLAELELLAYETGHTATDTVFICIRPFAAPRARDAGDWPAALHAMYSAWAARKGYEVATVSAPGQPPFVLRLHGPNLGTILSGEEGLHKLQRDADDPAMRGRTNAVVRLARVEVLPVRDSRALRLTAEKLTAMEHDAGTSGASDGKAAGGRTADCFHPTTHERIRIHADDAELTARDLLVALLGRAAPDRPPSEEIARVYHLGRTQYVRDPRTGLRQNRAREVLAGALDSFLVAYLERGANELPADTEDEPAEMAPVETGREQATRED